MIGLASKSSSGLDDRDRLSGRKRRPRTIVTLFGTRPEVIKLAPVIRALEARPDCWRTVNVSSSQHTDLLYPFAEQLSVRIDRDLAVMRAGQTPSEVLARVLGALEPVLAAERPDLLLVQGDTTTALAGALAAFHRAVAVGHVEAGLRSGDAMSPFPEEMNRRLITRLARYHFAATADNVAVLQAEGVASERIVLTGNTVVDSLQAILAGHEPSARLAAILGELHGLRLIALTTHRRESFGEVMQGHLRVLRRFVERHEDVALVFPVHPNPAVRATAEAALAGAPRVVLLEPLDYPDFIQLLSRSWLIVSDSGGVQEEAPTLGKPLLVLRENTERPEVLSCGVGRLVGNRPARLEALLEEAVRDGEWFERVRRVANPFGAGDSGPRIASAIGKLLDVEQHHP
jgi:UDP-N-acetylglucosamine 2-epimerase (non-hydrolysing)